MNDFINSVKSCLCQHHGITKIDLVETHISWVLLTGTIVYKIKKPVDFGFVDFTTLEKRRHFCFEELRLNKRLAPDLYIDVVAFTGDNARIEINGEQPVIDYAVRLKQFNRDDQLDNLINRHKLSRDHITQLAHIIADFHGVVNIASPDSRYGEPEVIHAASMENFRHCRQLLTDKSDLHQAESLHNWSNLEFERLYSFLQSRKQDGMVRECHGDLHLGNITLYHGQVTPFDCIEFNPEFRWIDVISEIAFLVMDLISRGRQDLAVEFLNEYLMITGDYSGLRCLRYYLVYRAMVRAKVEIIRAMQTSREPAQLKTALSNFYHYLELAKSFCRLAQPLLIITHGLSGSGKSTIAKKLQDHLFLVHLRSDIERKRLFRLQANDKSHSTVDTGIYTHEATQQTYGKLFTLAELLVQDHWNVVIDATFLRAKDRERARELALQQNAVFVIMDCKAQDSSLKQRVLAREMEPHAVSEATLSVLQRQITACEPLSTPPSSIIS